MLLAAVVMGGFAHLMQLDGASKSVYYEVPQRREEHRIRTQMSTSRALEPRGPKHQWAQKTPIEAVTPPLVHRAEYLMLRHESTQELAIATLRRGYNLDLCSRNSQRVLMMLQWTD